MKKLIRILLRITFFIYCFAVLSILFLSSRGRWSQLSLIDYMKSFSNLVPFRTIIGYYKGFTEGTMNLDIPIKNVLGNLILFLPMGFYLPYFFKKLRTFGKIFLCLFVIILSLEILQLLLRRGSFDIDDLILNLLGAIIGFGLWNNKITQKLLNKF